MTPTEYYDHCTGIKKDRQDEIRQLLADNWQARREQWWDTIGPGRGQSDEALATAREARL